MQPLPRTKSVPAGTDKIAGANEQRIPEGNADGGENQVASDILPCTSCHKGYVGAAKRNHTSEADCERPPFVKFLIGALNPVSGFGKAGFDGLEHFVAAIIAEEETESGADKTGDNAEEKYQPKGMPLCDGNNTGKGEDKFAGDRKTGVFKSDDDKHGDKTILIDKIDKNLHMVSAFLKRYCTYSICEKNRFRRKCEDEREDDSGLCPVSA